MTNARLAQRYERPLDAREGDGSTPSPGTLDQCARSSTDRAPDYGSGRWGFDSLRVRVTQTEALLEVLTDPALIGVGQRAIEDKLAARRDRGESRPLVSCGLVIGEPGSGESQVIRMTVQDALLIALVAIGNHVAAERDRHTATSTRSVAVS